MRRNDQGAAVDLSGEWLIAREPAGPSRPITLPSASQRVLGTDFHGAVWLTRTVPAPVRSSRATGRRVWLRFEAAATDLQAWVNGASVGRHVGDYVPFQFEITDAIRDDRPIELALRVDEIRAEPPQQHGDLQGGHITKGFHDVISIQHGGVWQPLSLQTTGAVCAVPDGVAVLGRRDGDRGRVRVIVELEPRPSISTGRVEVIVRDPEGVEVARGARDLDASATHVELDLALARPREWSPQRPELYSAQVDLLDEHGLSQRHRQRFGLRAVRAEGRQILLNGVPILLRGVLDWGHEPHAIAPDYGPRRTRAIFARLRSMGFNTVCLCMWYPPRHFYEIADETGMLLWQEHPVWQSRMDDADLSEYRRLYSAFLRRDRRHASVVVVSATCEHPSFHPELARWWWAAAREALPDTVLELQTASFKWADHQRSDLYDEHTYDNSNRWPSYLADVEAHMAAMPPKPFVMGETSLFTSWPDVEALWEHSNEMWWRPRGLGHMKELEADWVQRYGPDTPQRLRRAGDRFHLLGRKFQVEQFRRRWGFAGIVMNHLRDVPSCQCGFMDDLGRYRFAPAACRGWLGDAALLLCTPQERRGYCPAEERVLACRLALSNFSEAPIEGPAQVTLSGGPLHRVTISSKPLRAAPGEITSVPLDLPLPSVTRPTRLNVRARIQGAAPNDWDLWLFPAGPRLPRRAWRFDGLPFVPEEALLDEVERGYSRGFGLSVVSWQAALPDPTALVGDLAPWPGPDGAGLLVTHRLTVPIVEWLCRGGRVVLLASQARGGPPTRYEWLFGQVQLVIERGPLRRGEGRWLVDLLGYDLTRRAGRVIPVGDLGIADRVDPLLRLVYTHDQKQRVQLFDMLFMATVGSGLLLVSALDHFDDAGAYLLRRLIAWAARPAATCAGRLDPEVVAAWACAE